MNHLTFFTELDPRQPYGRNFFVQDQHGTYVTTKDNFYQWRRAYDDYFRKPPKLSRKERRRQKAADSGYSSSGSNSSRSSVEGTRGGPSVRQSMPVSPGNIRPISRSISPRRKWAGLPSPSQNRRELAAKAYEENGQRHLLVDTGAGKFTRIDKAQGRYIEALDLEGRQVQRHFSPKGQYLRVIDHAHTHRQIQEHDFRNGAHNPGVVQQYRNLLPNAAAVHANIDKNNTRKQTQVVTDAGGNRLAKVQFSSL